MSIPPVLPSHRPAVVRVLPALSRLEGLRMKRKHKLCIWKRIQKRSSQKSPTVETSEHQFQSELGDAFAATRLLSARIPQTLTSAFMRRSKVLGTRSARTQFALCNVHFSEGI